MTALVTGASTGIGREFARGLAARKHDLVLVARDTERLETVAKEVEAEHGVDTELLPADLTDHEARARVEARLAAARPDAQPIDVLVNNAGLGMYGDFVDLDVDGEQRQVELNVLALVRLSHAALVAMVGRGHGVVVNVSSTAGQQPMPHHATYGATKAFVTSFTHAVHEEVRDRGVHVMAVLPGYTRTEFHSRAGVDTGGVPDMMWMTAEQVVEQALRDLDRRRTISVPGISNRVVAAVSGASPPSLSRKFSARLSQRLS